MQRVYDKEISDSNVFIALIGNHIGNWTRYEIEDIAFQSPLIAQKIIFTKGSIPLPKEWSRLIEIKSFKDDFTNNITNVLFNIFEKIQKDLPEQDWFPISNNFLTIYSSNREITLINSIIGNIIRSYNDQRGDLYSIRIETNLESQFFDSYLTVIANAADNQDAEQQVLRLLDFKIPLESLWLFTNSTIPEPHIVRYLREEYHKYADLFSTHEDFSKLFKIRLINTILDRIRQKDNINKLFVQEFCYVVEDHFLKRVSLTNSEKKITIKNLYNIDTDLETQTRKERIIVHCMNMYHGTPGMTEKYKEALSALEIGFYEFFFSNLNDVTDGISDSYERFIDCAIEKALLLQRKTLTKTENFIVSEADNINISIKKSRFNLDVKDRVKISSLLGDIMYALPSQVRKAEKFYNEAFCAFSREPDYDDLSVVNMILNIIISECEIRYKENDDEAIIRWVNTGFGIIKKCLTRKNFDCVRCKCKLLIYAARASRNLNLHDVEKQANELISEYGISIISTDMFYKEAENLIINKFKEDNETVDLYIKLLYEITVNKIMSGETIDSYGLLIEELKLQNDKYLNSSQEYHAEYILANQYIFFLSAVKTKDCQQMDIIIKGIIENRILDLNNQGLLDMLYVYSHILRKKNLHQEAIIILDNLAKKYVGKRDIAICRQNEALSHMHLYMHKDELIKAEAAYLTSLILFRELKDYNSVGNVCDGLSFCYILQGDIKKAEPYVKDSIKNEEYTSPNKYANYLSFLMCSGKIVKAFIYFYFVIREKGRVRNILNQDWSNQSEMCHLGVDVRNFNKLFLIYDLFHKHRQSII